MARRKQPVDGWAAQVLLKLTKEDLGVLHAISHPGEDRVATYLRVAREAVLPADVLLRYRMPPGSKGHAIFPDWMVTGPFSPTTALDRALRLQDRGFEVETQQTSPKVPTPRWDDEEGEEDACCDGCGGDLIDGVCYAQGCECYRAGDPSEVGGD